MVKNNRYYFTRVEYIQFTEGYFIKSGLSLSKSKFDTLFFDKGILVQDAEHVYFRFKSILQYFIARKLQRDSQALNWVLLKENYINFADEISFLTGLDRTRLDILQYIEYELNLEIDKYMPTLQCLSNYGLSNIEFDPAIKETIHELKMTDEEKDRLLDFPDFSADFETQIIEKQDISEYPDKYIFMKLLNLYGKIIRHSEVLDLPVKATALDLYMTGCCILLADIKLQAEKNLTVENIQKLMDNAEIQQRIHQEHAEMIQNIIKISAPLLVQNLAAETVGTGKLDTVLLDRIQHVDNEFLKFMYVFLYSDLKLDNLLDVVERYLNSIRSRDIIYLSIFKMLHYYQTSHIRKKDDERLVALIADTILRFNNQSKILKGNIMNAIRKPDIEIKKLIAEN